MTLKDEKTEKSLNKLMLVIKTLDKDINDLQERASLKIHAVEEDYEYFVLTLKKNRKRNYRTRISF